MLDRNRVCAGFDHEKRCPNTHVFSGINPAANQGVHFLVRIPFPAYVPAADRKEETVICGTLKEQNCINSKLMSFGNIG